jgi:hypothetical protein
LVNAHNKEIVMSPNKRTQRTARLRKAGVTITWALAGMIIGGGILSIAPGFAIETKLAFFELLETAKLTQQQMPSSQGEVKGADKSLICMGVLSGGAVGLLLSVGFTRGIVRALAAPICAQYLCFWGWIILCTPLVWSLAWLTPDLMLELKSVIGSVGRDLVDWVGFTFLLGMLCAAVDRTRCERAVWAGKTARWMFNMSVFLQIGLTAITMAIVVIVSLVISWSTPESNFSFSISITVVLLLGALVAVALVWISALTAIGVFRRTACFLHGGIGKGWTVVTGISGLIVPALIVVIQMPLIRYAAWFIDLGTASQDHLSGKILWLLGGVFIISGAFSGTVFTLIAWTRAGGRAHENFLVVQRLKRILRTHPPIAHPAATASHKHA